MREPIRAVKGMNDFFPASVPRKEVLPDSGLWQWFESCVRTVLGRYGYQNVLTPIVEATDLFERGLGEVTDIVEKEMYSFTDAMNGDRLTLRPEATAGIVRAMIEHNALYNGPLRVWTMGPMFRHERPQKGRYRQFHQLDVEALGFAGPEIDAEMILVARALCRELGLVEGTHIRLEINSLGQPAERKAHRDALVGYFGRHEGDLDADAKRRLHANPLRILDSKTPAMQPLLDGAPKLIDFLGAESLAHFDAVQAMLRHVGLTFVVNPRLVRGIDYYNLTVFEWITDRLGSQGTVCAGGRYDGLFQQLGGKPTPAIGFGLGIERLLLLIRALEVPVPAVALDVYAVVPDESTRPQAIAILERLRQDGVTAVMHAGDSSVKAQFRKANASGARYALVFGGEELARGAIGRKDLRNEMTPQTTPLLSDWDALVRDLKGAGSRLA